MPLALDKALADRADELEDINVRTLLCIRPIALMEANERLNRNVFTINSWHFSGYERQYAAKGYAFTRRFDIRKLRFYIATKMILNESTY